MLTFICWIRVKLKKIKQVRNRSVFGKKTKQMLQFLLFNKIQNTD